MSRGRLPIPPVEVHCPYCRHKNKVRYEYGIFSEAVCCDVESGGCDQHFFVTGRANVVVTATAYCIEGFSQVEPAPNAQGGDA
jgi:hypothetical protein